MKDLGPDASFSFGFDHRTHALVWDPAVEIAGDANFSRLRVPVAHNDLAGRLALFFFGRDVVAKFRWRAGCEFDRECRIVLGAVGRGCVLTDRDAAASGLAQLHVESDDAVKAQVLE